MTLGDAGRSVFRAGILLLTPVMLAGCTTTREFGGDPALRMTGATELPSPESAPIRDGDPETYSIGPNDQLLIGVFGIEGLQERQVNVDSNGNLSFPLAGMINASGMTPADLSAAITQRLRAAHIRDPQVTVNLKQQVSRVFTVDGQVTKPGIYPIEGKATLIRAVATAGSTSEYARLDDVVIFRTVGDQRYAALYNLGAIREGRYPDPRIYADDVIVVGESSARRLFKDVLQIAPGLLSPLVVLLTN